MSQKLHPGAHLQVFPWHFFAPSGGCITANPHVTGVLHIETAKGTTPLQKGWSGKTKFRKIFRDPEKPPIFAA